MTAPLPEIAVALVPRPAELTWRRLRDFVLEMVVTNRGPQPIPDALESARLLVNGEDSIHFAFSVGNGIREYGQYRVPPGETRAFSWPGLGPGLFDRRGHYTLVLVIQGVASPPVRVSVRR